MNAEAIRHFYSYHFAENRVLWERYVERLTSDQFTLPLAYAHGSVRDQILHLMDVDDVWLSELEGLEPVEPAPAVQGDEAEALGNDAAFVDALAQAFVRFTAFLGARALDATAIREPLLRQRISAVTESRV